MSKSQNINLLFCSCFVLLSLMAFVQATPPYITPQECGENEFYTECGADCQTECSTLYEPCLIRHIRCPEGCYCNDGFARDDSGKCIPIEYCPPSTE